MNTMYLAITDRCNHRCVICPHGGTHTDGYIAPPQLWETVEKAKAAGIRQVTVSGGEPFLYPAIFELLAHLADEGMAATILTNGTVLCEEAVFQKLLDNAPCAAVSFVVSIHSHHKEENDRLAGRDGSFVQSVAAVQRLAAAGYTVQVKHCVHKGNYRYLRAFAYWFTKTFPSVVRLHFCNIDYCGLTAETVREVAVPLHKSGAAIGRALAVLQRAGDTRRVTLSEVPLCTLPRRWRRYATVAGRFAAYTDPRTVGEVQPPRGMENPFEKCKRCRKAEACGGVWCATARYWRQQ